VSHLDFYLSNIRQYVIAKETGIAYPIAEKPRLHTAQKDLRSEAREITTSAGVRLYVGARRLSAPFDDAQGSRHMSLFQGC